MNVYKYIYIKFYEARKSIIGKNLGDAETCLLFVVLVDCWFYWGGILLFDGLMGYVLVSQYSLVFGILLIGGQLVILWLRKKDIYKEDFKRIKRKKDESKTSYKFRVHEKSFERIQKEVADEPRKVFWGVFSLLYVLFAFSFFALSLYLWAIKIIPSPFKIPD